MWFSNFDVRKAYSPKQLWKSKRRSLSRSREVSLSPLLGGRGSWPSDDRCSLSRHIPTNMIIRLGRLTPGYFRLLQRQVAGEVQMQPKDRMVNQIAMMLAIMGLGLSYYSTRRMTEVVATEPGD